MKNRESGQALFEFIFFIVPLIVVIGIMHNLASAINGSINQQKATRSYFYYRLSNNSTAPTRSLMGQVKSISKMGIYLIGWREHGDGDSQSSSSYATCYKNPRMLSAGESLDCEDLQGRGTSSSPSSEFIKVMTAYGTCGNFYTIESSVLFKNNFLNRGAGSCVVVK